MTHDVRLLASMKLTMFVLVVASGPAFAANLQAHDDCDADDPDRNIAGCTRIIEDADEGKTMRGVAYVARGLAWQKKGDLDRALADYTEAIKINPKDALAYNNRGMLWRERGDSDRAIADFTAAIAIDPLPRSDEAYSRRGNAIVAKRDVNVYENRALALLERSDFDGAIADFNSAINLDPNGADSFNGRGAALRAKGELDRAKADFSYAIKLDRTHMGAYYNRGLVEVAKGELDPAVADSRPRSASIRISSTVTKPAPKRSWPRPIPSTPLPTSTRQFAATPIARATITCAAAFDTTGTWVFSAAAGSRKRIWNAR